MGKSPFGLYRRKVMQWSNRTRIWAARLGILAPIGWRLVVGCVIGIGDNVRLSASAVNAGLALSHTHGDYNRRVLVVGMVIARVLKTVFCR